MAYKSIVTPNPIHILKYNILCLILNRPKGDKTVNIHDFKCIPIEVQGQIKLGLTCPFHSKSNWSPKALLVLSCSLLNI